MFTHLNVYLKCQLKLIEHKFTHYGRFFFQDTSNQAENNISPFNLLTLPQIIEQLENDIKTFLQTSQEKQEKCQP